MSGPSTAAVPSGAARPADDARAPTTGTAWTLVVFFVGAAFLSAAPGVPAVLRPLDASTPEARAGLLASVLARPRVTLVEHERRLAGEHDRHGGDGDEDAIPNDDVDDSDGGVAQVDVGPPAPARGPPRDRAAFLDAFPPTAAELASAATHKRLAMPGGVVDNPCIERDGDGACRRTALEPLFATLDAIVAGDPLARADIVVLGNSLIASDHVVDIVRRELVARFGDGGRGLLLPERLSTIAGRRARTGLGSSGWTPRTFALDTAGPDNVFGLTGSFHEAAADGESIVWKPDGATSGRLRWLDDGRPMRLDIDGREVLRIAAHGSPSRRPRDRGFRVPPGARSVRLVAGRGARVVDVVFERDTPGVVVDTIGVPAASARGFVEQTDAQAFVDELAAREPTLVVTMLGGNETRSLAFGQLDDATLTDALTRLVERTRAAAPQAACLIVTPIDAAKTTTGDDRLVTRPEIHRVIDAERRVASTMGCGFFDLFAAMGGEGSLGRMRDAGLVAEDLVHPRPQGCDALGSLVSRALLASWRTTAPARTPQVGRRSQPDARRPRFAGLSFPEEDGAVVVAGDDDGHARARPRALARFFARLSALEDGRRSRVAIGQFGASHTAGQMLTDRMRQRLGARFGEAGRGYVPAGTASNRLTPSGVFREVTGAYDVADGREVGSGGAVGMAGTKLRLAPGSRFRVGFCKGCPFDSTRTTGALTLSWLYTPDMGVADVFVDGVRLATVSPAQRRHDSDVQHLVVPISAERATLDVVVRAVGPVGPGDDGDAPVGPVHLLSVAEEMDRRGIVLDAAGLPGTTGMTPQRWRQDLLAEEVRARDYDLVITAWGTNEAGIRSLDETTYRRHFGATLGTLLGATPRADCLIIGATDRFDRHGDELEPAPSHELVERAQRAIAAERGCAFYSLRTLMGGPGSMRRWVADGLARADHVHFTREGYARLADAIVDDLLAAYAWSGSDPERADDDDAPVGDMAVRASSEFVEGGTADDVDEDVDAVSARITRALTTATSGRER